MVNGVDEARLDFSRTLCFSGVSDGYKINDSGSAGDTCSELSRETLYLAGLTNKVRS